MEWTHEDTSYQNPKAVLKDGDKVICKVYLSPDLSTLRIVLPELKEFSQLKINCDTGIVDVRRKP